MYWKKEACARKMAMKGRNEKKYVKEKKKKKREKLHVKEVKERFLILWILSVDH